MRIDQTPASKRIVIGEVRRLKPEDIASLQEGNRTPPLNLQRIRDSHHWIARLAAMGMKHGDIATKTGYSTVRISMLLASPALQDLVARYRDKVDEAFKDNADEFLKLATSNMLAAERHIADKIAELDEQGELLPVRTALAISRDAADRFGYSKHQVNHNVNHDFAALLERAIKRSGIQQLAQSPRLPEPTSSQPLIELTVTEPTPFRRRA